MKKTLLLKLYIIITLVLLAIGNVFSQVGINTTSPQAGSMLDVDSPDKGILVPRVDISNLNTIAPITGGATESLLVYNTNTSTGKGFYYWTGSLWVPIEGDDWETTGNVGTNPATRFIGTTDNVGLRFRTDNTERLEITNNGRIRAFTSGSAASPLFAWDADDDVGFYRPTTDALGLVSNGSERFRIPNANQVHAMADGTSSLPFYSWNTDTDTGMWRSTDNRLNFSAGAVEFLELSDGGTPIIRFNDGGLDMNTRIESNNDTNAFWVDGGNDNIGMGTNTPNTSSQLELADNDRGILINRVALTATNNASPVTSPATGLLVYNTANSSSGSTEVLPGFYYWNGGQWVAMGGTGGRDWSLEGNAGTNPGTNFLGTTDDVDFRIRTNDTERIWVDNAGTVGIGSAPFTDTALRVQNTAQPFGVISQTSSTGVALYGEDTGSGLGIYGTSSQNHGIFGITSYTGSAFLIGGIIGWGSGFNGANGVLAVASEQSTSRSNMGIRAVSGSTTSISSNQILNVGVNTNATDLALYALTESPITNGIDIEAARFQSNYTGIAIDADSRDPRAQLAGYTTNSLAGGGTMYYGAYMYSGGSNSNSSYAYGGARFNGTNYKIIGNGTVSTFVKGASENDSAKVMFAPEAPEVLFEDYGTEQLVNGTANISIDPILRNNIVVDSEHPLKVFIQLEGDCNGVYVTNKSANGFTVKELQKGTSNVAFSWHIVANRVNSGGRSAGEALNFANLRFPDAPAPFQPDTAQATEMETDTASLQQKIGSSLENRN